MTQLRNNDGENNAGLPEYGENFYCFHQYFQIINFVIHLVGLKVSRKFILTIIVQGYWYEQ